MLLRGPPSRGLLRGCEVSSNSDSGVEVSQGASVTLTGNRIASHHYFEFDAHFAHAGKGVYVGVSSHVEDVGDANIYESNELANVFLDAGDEGVPLA